MNGWKLWKKGEFFTVGMTILYGLVLPENEREHPGNELKGGSEDFMTLRQAVVAITSE